MHAAGRRHSQMSALVESVLNRSPMSSNVALDLSEGLTCYSSVRKYLGIPIGKKLLIKN